MLVRMLTFSFCFMSVLTLHGCQPRSTQLNHVSGKVIYKNTPLRGGIIVFSPDTSRGENGKIAFGKILEDGSYSLLTDNASGVTAGWYRVTVAALSGAVASLDAPPLSVIPEKYRDPQLSLLQCEVKANRDNHLDFNLD